MSTTTSTTTYKFGFFLNPGDDTETAFFAFTGACLDDSSALALAEAVKGVTWPTGVTATVQVERVDATDVDYVGDLNATPPAFT